MEESEGTDCPFLSKNNALALTRRGKAVLQRMLRSHLLQEQRS